MTHSKIFFTTVADDRFGRKNGQYSQTQDQVYRTLKSHSHLKISGFFFWKFQDLLSTDFYRENQQILEHTDPAINGRCYKPFVIWDSLQKIGDGDFLIYNDVSPEHWVNVTFDSDVFDLQVLKDLCASNGGILSAETIWIAGSELGPHTHENFTTDICMETMGMKKYQHSLQHASGLIVLQKNRLSLEFASEWLKWNVIPECASLSSLDGSKSFYQTGKMGHRHDQSISGLLINDLGLKILKNAGGFNFITYCRKNCQYELITTDLPPSEYIYNNVFENGKWGVSKVPRNPQSEPSSYSNPLRLP